MSMDRLRVKYLAEKDRPGAKRLEKLLAQSDDLLSAILVGNNLVNIMVSVFATALLIDLFDQRGELMTILIRIQSIEMVHLCLLVPGHLAMLSGFKLMVYLQVSMNLN